VTETVSRDALATLLDRPALQRLLDALNGNGEETRIVGGAVRNALLGHPVTEVDCSTTAAPDVTTRRASQAGFKPVPTGIEHGTVTVVVEGEPFEVTSLREDVETDGRRAVVRFGRDFSADARRRDFTINALSLDRDGRLHD
jgi:poly(A) polymerase